MSKTIIALSVVAVIIALIVGAWLVVRSPASTTPSDTGGGANPIPTNGATTPTGTANTPEQGGTSVTPTSNSNVSSWSERAVLGATFIQTTHPTTTLIRYIEQGNGHVSDLPVDVAGAIPRVVSNTTIPGGERVVWVDGGMGALIQYPDSNSVKTVYLGFPASSTASSKTRILFLQNNISDITAAPDSKAIAYLVKTSTGVDGYTAHTDGTGALKLFSLPLYDVILTWPSPSSLLVYSKAASGVPGIAFSIDAKSGAVVPVIYAPGLTATEARDRSAIVYQTDAGGGSEPVSYVRNIKAGTNMVLDFSPLPEKCTWSPSSLQYLFCAVPTAASAGYVDQWHMGTVNGADAIFRFSIANGSNRLIIAPATPSTILSISISGDEHYLAYITAGDHLLWGVRLP